MAFRDIAQGIEFFGGFASGLANSFEKRRQLEQAEQLQLLNLLAKDPESQLAIAQPHEVADAGVPTFKLGGQLVTVKPRQLLGQSGLFSLAGAGTTFDVAGDPLISTFDSSVATKDNIAGLRKTIVERTEGFAKARNSLLADIRKSPVLSPGQQSELVDRARAARSFATLEELAGEFSAFEGATRTQDQTILQGTGAPGAQAGTAGQTQAPAPPGVAPAAPAATGAPLPDSAGRLSPEQQVTLAEELVSRYGYSPDDARQLVAGLPAGAVLRAPQAPGQRQQVTPQKAPQGSPGPPTSVAPQAPAVQKAPAPVTPPPTPTPATDPGAPPQLSPADTRRLTRLEAERDTLEGTLARLEQARSKLTSESARSEMGKRIDDARANLTRLEGSIDTLRKRAEPSNEIIQTEQGPFLFDKKTGRGAPLSADGLPLPPKPLNENQGRAFSFGSRALQANVILSDLEARGVNGQNFAAYLAEQGGVLGAGLGAAAGAGLSGVLAFYTGGVGLIGAGSITTASGALGGGLGIALSEPLANALRTPDEKLYAQAKLDFISSVLRKESGAAISVGEIRNEDRRLFPQSGDSEAVIRQKAASRAQVLTVLEREAGRKLERPQAPTQTPQGTSGAPAQSPQGTSQPQPTAAPLTGTALREAVIGKLRALSPATIRDRVTVSDEVIAGTADVPLTAFPLPQQRAIAARRKALGVPAR